MALIPRRRPDFVDTVGPLKVQLWSIGEDAQGRIKWAYRFFDHGWPSPDPIFEAADFKTPLGYDNERKAVSGLLGFLTLKEGDTDDEYFEGYTPEQIRWRDARAEEAQLYALDYEERINKPRPKGPKTWSPRNL